MSDLIARIIGRVPSDKDTPSADFTKPVLLFAACALACIAIALVEGKDFNWDFRNYHLYGPWALLHHRYDMDFMAGGPQGYLNPLGYLPLYLMVTGGLDDRLAVALLATIHALCPFFTCLIANRLFADATRTARYWLVAASGLLAMLAPVFWGLAGNTFIDPLATALLLASLHACLRAADGVRGQWLASGLLFGLGLALKLTLLLFAPAMAVAVLAGLRWKQWAGAAWWAIGATAGALLAGGVPALALYRAYGSPVFPLFNAIFRSSFATTTATAAHERFTPDSAWEFLLRPLRMLDAHSMVYIENSAPEARLLVMFALLAVAVAWLLGRRVAGRAADAGAVSRSSDLRAWLQFWGFFLVGWTCWLLGSGNGRYGLPLFLLAGPAIVALLRLLLPAKFIAHAVLLLATVQGFLLLSSFEHRWTQANWSGRWIEVDTSPVDRRAHGYILVDTNTNSAVFPSLDAGSGYFAIAGQMPQSSLPAIANRLHAFKQRYHARLRLLYGVGEHMPDRLPPHKIELLALHGLRPADPGTTRGCSIINVRGDRSGRYLSYQRLLSCPLVAMPPDDDVRARQREFEALFDRVAATCRLWFPAGSDNPPLPRAAGWERRYDPTDVTLFTWKGEVLLSRGDFGPFDVRLGSIEDWNAGRARKPDCRPLPRHYASDGVLFLR